MRNEGEQEQAPLNEPLEGSGFEDETPDPSFDVADPDPQTGNRRLSKTKKERRHVE